MSASITIGPHRVSFPSGLFEPNDNDNYGLAVLLSKETDQAVYDKLKALVRSAVEETWPNPETRPRLANPIKDCDEPSSTQEGVPMAEKYAEMAGHWLIRVVCKRRPPVYDKNPKNLVIEANRVYGGMWMNIYLNAFTWTYQGKKGVSFGLNCVQIVRDDEAFGGATASAEAAGFKPVDEPAEKEGEPGWV